MFVDHYRTEYLNAIVQLEKETFPGDVLLGTPFLEEAWTEYDNRSLCAFSNGKLAGYLLAYEKPRGTIHIADLNGKSPSALYHLLACLFFERPPDSVRYIAFCQPNTYRMLKKKGIRQAVHIERHRKKKKYYVNDVDAHQIIFRFNQNIENDWKYRFIAEVFRQCGSNPCDIKTAEKILKLILLSDDHIQKAMAFAEREINRRNRDIAKGCYGISRISLCAEPDNAVTWSRQYAA